MSTVAPNGIVRLLENVPIDDKYEDTLWFDSKASQTAHFTSLTPVHQMTNATRVRDGVIAVDCVEDKILKCNYLMFQNQNFSNKWFYAFIKNREYVNNNTTYVTYEIDPMQTYGFDIQLLDCLIEREHTLIDEIGSNIVGESMGASELKCKVLDTENMCEGDLSQRKLVVLNTCVYYDNNNPTVAPMGITDGIANESLTYAWSYTDSTSEVTAPRQMIEALTENQQSESIIGGFILPYKLFKDFHATKYIEGVGGEGMHTNDDATQHDSHFDFTTSGAFTDLDGYIPKNKKMFTAPFNWIYLLSTDGQFLPLRPEYMGNKNSVRLQNYHCIVGVPEARLVLQNYKGETECSEMYIAYSDFPQLSYAVDGYKAWLASGGERKLDLGVSQVTRQQELAQSQTKFNATLSAVKDVGQVAKGVTQLGKEKTRATGVENILGGVVSGVSDIGNAIYTLEGSQQTIQFANENADLQRSIAKNLPMTSHGTCSNTALLGANNIKINAEQRCVNANIAKTIDDYFTMFGYAVNEVKKPTLHNRSRYTYVKTIGCKVNGGAPTEDITKIESILNSGCRFWADHDHVRDYGYADNLPLGINS